MDETSLILYGLSELVALIFIVRLWLRRRVRLLPRFLWSLVLLFPIFGPIVYLFLHEEPKEHPYRLGDSGWNAGDSGTGGGDYGGGHGGH